MDTENRACTFCGYEVVLQDISDAHGPGVVQFLDPKSGVVEQCPNCKTKLSRENTLKVKS